MKIEVVNLYRAEYMCLDEESSMGIADLHEKSTGRFIRRLQGKISSGGYVVEIDCDGEVVAKVRDGDSFFGRMWGEYKGEPISVVGYCN